MNKKEKLCERYTEEYISDSMIASIIAKNFGCGTGFFVRENLIVTNIHCVAGATSVSAKLLESNTEYVVEGVAAYDAINDLVILKVESQGIPFPIYNSDLIEKGETVKAIGCPYGKYMTTEGKFHSIMNNGKWLLTTAKTNDGYSGGPLLNGKRQVIGINFGSGKYYSGAISSNLVNELLLQLHTIESFTKWKEKDQIRAYVYLVDSKTKNMNNNYVGAIDDLNEVINKLNPSIVIAYENRGTIKRNIANSENDNLSEAQKLLQSAIDDFNKAISLCPDFAKLYYERGLAKSDLSKYITDEDDLTNSHQLLQKTIDDFTKAITLFSDYPLAFNNRADAKLNLGKIEEKMGKMQTAQDLYQEAIIDINSAIEKHINNPIEEDQDTALFHHTRGEIKEVTGDLLGAIDDFKETMKNNEYTENSEVSVDLERVKEAFEDTQ